MRPHLLRWEPRWTASPTCCRTSSRSCWRSRSTRTTLHPATTERATPIRKAEKRTSIIIQTSSLSKCFDFLKYTFVFFSEIRQKIISAVFVGLFSGFALWASSCWIWWCYINLPKRSHRKPTIELARLFYSKRPNPKQPTLSILMLGFWHRCTM